MIRRVISAGCHRRQPWESKPYSIQDDSAILRGIIAKEIGLRERWRAKSSRSLPWLSRCWGLIAEASMN